MIDQYKRFFLANIFILLLTTPSIVYANKSLKDLQTQRKLFLQAEEQLKKHKNLYTNTEILRKFAVPLANYPLYPYLHFTILQQSINEISLVQLKNFINNYNDTPLIMPLKNAWLINAAKQERWKDFLDIYQEKDYIDGKNNAELECYYIQAISKNLNLKVLDQKIQQLWLTGSCQPKSCDVVFDKWKSQGLMTKSMVWQRIKLAINNNNISLAKFLATNYLPKIEHPVVELWINVNKNPYLIIKKQYFNSIKHPAIAEILMHGILKIAKKESDQAIRIWKILSELYNFTERHFNYIIKAIAISLAKEVHPRSWEWLNKINKEYRDQEVYNLQLTLALKQSRWDRIVDIYKDLPDAIKNQERWLYWYARALEMQNRSIESKNILIEVSNKRSYYGFLSSAKLLRPYNFKFRAVNVTAAQIDVILKNKAVQRAYELLQLDRMNKATQEWNMALKNMVEWELHAAAKLADRLNIPNWAISALSDAKQQDDLSLRFPQYYSQHIVNEAKKNRLDPAWVFAITRQESAFRPYVKSYAGALGLMQLMPRTGFMVAKTINMRLKNHNDILDINNNVRLGSKYLQLMLERYKNLVVATAAYNAGPGRVQKWLPNHDIAADVWVETIPFKDTREYVQNVMAHTVIYQKLLGYNHYLNMPLIRK